MTEYKSNSHRSKNEERAKIEPVAKAKKAPKKDTSIKGILLGNVPNVKEYKNLGGFKMNEMNNNMELGLVEEETTMEHDVVSQPELVEQEAETSMGEILVSALAGAVIGVATVVVADKLNKHVFEPAGRKLINKFKEAKAKRATETEEDIVVEVEESTETKTEDVEK